MLSDIPSVFLEAVNFPGIRLASRVANSRRLSYYSASELFSKCLDAFSVRSTGGSHR